MKEKHSASQDIYQILKEKIINLEYKPNQILMVHKLAQEYNISRTPVREAVVRLHKDRFLEETEGRKFRVSEITWQSIENLYSLRIILESATILNSTKSARHKLLPVLKKHNAAMEKAHKNNQLSDFFEYDQKFHETILLLADNDIINNFCSHLNDLQQRIRFLTMSINTRINNTVKEHADIVDALQAEKLDEAAALVKEHLDSTVRELKELCDSNPIYRAFIK